MYTQVNFRGFLSGIECWRALDSHNLLSVMPPATTLSKPSLSGNYLKIYILNEFILEKLKLKVCD